MKHVVWSIGSSGPGIVAARSFLHTFFQFGGKPIAETGPIDAEMVAAVVEFQKIYNGYLANPKVNTRAVRGKMIGARLIETGSIDFNTRAAMGIPEALAADDAIALPAGVKIESRALTAIELAAGQGKSFAGSAFRLAGLDKLLEALQLKDGKAGAASKMRIAPLAEGRMMVPQGHPLFAAAKEASECAALPQSFGVPDTNQWIPGPRVQDVETIEPGTIVATLGSGVYLSDYSGKSHIGVLLSKDRLGFTLLDQWRGEDGELGIRYKKFNTPHNKKLVDPNKYINDQFSYRYPVKNEAGEIIGWGRDHSYETVKYKTNLTADGSEYFILMSTGKVARHDIDRPKPRNMSNGDVAGAMVDYLFDGVDFKSSIAANAAALKAALDQVKPTAPAPHGPAPR